MNFSKQSICCILILIILYLVLIINHLTHNTNQKDVIVRVLSPTEFILEDGKTFIIKDIDIFDSEYTIKNNKLAKQLGLSEDEAFIFGNFGKYWAKNILEGRNVRIKDNDLVYYKFRYIQRLKNSSYALINGKPCNQTAYERQLKNIKRGKYVLLDLDTDKYYTISKFNASKIKNYVVVRKSHLKFNNSKTFKNKNQPHFSTLSYVSGNIKLIVSDLTTKIFPDRNCSSDICKEIIYNINNAKSTIDMAIYGYSSTPAIEQALSNAIKRGVRIRLVYDINNKGENIYPDTFKLIKLLQNNRNDSNSEEARYTMHNKFYIFDNKILITGSANLSHTDMSGYNSNSIIVINSPYVANIYKTEFEQMYNGKFHNNKVSNLKNNKISNLQIFFSPQDKAIQNGLIPLIKNADKYIYIPTFVITEKNITKALIEAKNRGVDVKIIADALNSSTQHSKHKEIRNAGIPIKAENYAGKMHSKTMIIDDKYLVIGSMNFSNSGENKNDENLIIIQDSGTCKFYKMFFLYQWNKIPDKWLKYVPRAEGQDSVGSCSDGIDNNYDGLTDMEDSACKTLK